MHKNDIKNIEIIELERPYNFQSPFKGKEFALLLYVIDQTISNDEQNLLSDQFVIQGCRYAVCAGHKCSTWDDSIDWAALEKNDFEEKDDCFVMTTWHQNQSIDDIVFFFIRNTSFDTFTPKNYCVLFLGHDRIIKHKVLLAISKMNS